MKRVAGGLDFGGNGCVAPGFQASFGCGEQSFEKILGVGHSLTGMMSQDAPRK